MKYRSLPGSLIIPRVTVIGKHPLSTQHPPGSICPVAREILSPEPRKAKPLWREQCGMKLRRAGKWPPAFYHRKLMRERAAKLCRLQNLQLPRKHLTEVAGKLLCCVKVCWAFDRWASLAPVKTVPAQTNINIKSLQISTSCMAPRLRLLSSQYICSAPSQFKHIQYCGNLDLSRHSCSVVAVCVFQLYF